MTATRDRFGFVVTHCRSCEGTWRVSPGVMGEPGYREALIEELCLNCSERICCRCGGDAKDHLRVSKSKRKCLFGSTTYRSFAREWRRNDTLRKRAAGKNGVV